MINNEQVLIDLLRSYFQYRITEKEITKIVTKIPTSQKNFTNCKNTIENTLTADI